jgi:HSP20 family protein
MLTRWNPFNGTDLFREADAMLRSSLLTDAPLPNSNWSVATLAPTADVCETPEGLEVKLDLPGHDPSALQVQLEAQKLTVNSERKQPAQKDARYLRAERMYGSFTRTFVLPRTVDTQRAEAKFEHGVLTIKLPLREEARPRTIDVKVEH